MKKVLLIFNAKAGKLKSKSVLFDVLEPFSGKATVTVSLTAYGGHARELARDAKGYDMLVVCGGDGTLNEVVQGLMESGKNIPIGYIPAGSTNDFAASLDLSGDHKKAVKTILEGKSHTLDVGSFDGRYFTYIASFGAFTSTSYNTPQSTKNVLGHQAYVLEGIKELSNLQPYHIKLSSKEKELSGEYMFGAVSNTTSVAGMLRLDAEFVDMNDGLLEVLLVKQPKNLPELQQVLSGLIFSDFSGDMFEFFKTSEVVIESDGSFPWSLDGEKADGKKKITIKAIPDAIKIIK